MLYAMGIAAAGLAFAAVYEDYTLREVAARAQATEAMHKEATSKLSQLTNEVAQQKPNAQIEADIAALEAQLKGRQEVVETLRSGVELTLKQLVQVFEKSRLKEINPVGEKFDPHRHQAISMLPSDKEPNTVINVLQKGYLLHERVLRPALVAIAKAVEKPADSPISSSN